MNAIRRVTAVGTVQHLEGHVVVVPTRAPEATRPSRLERERQICLSQNSGLGGDATRIAPATVPAASTIEDVRQTHDRYAVALLGADIPPERIRARITGDLEGRILRVASWSVEPESSSGWERPDVVGTDLETANAIVESFISQDWETIGFGISVTSSGRYAATVEVEIETPEVEDWLSGQPQGSVHLIPFLR
jgi:hypothetical protein